MALGGVLTLLSENPVKAVLLVAGIGGLVAWVGTPAGDPVKEVEGRCAVLRLPTRSIHLEPGSDQEGRFLLMVPARQRARLGDGRWMFCRANLLSNLVGGASREERRSVSR